MKKLTIGAALAAAALGTGIGLLNAQQPGFTRTVLQDQDLTAQGRHAVVVHDGKNVGKGKAVVLATYVVEKGKPVATAIK